MKDKDKLVKEFAQKHVRVLDVRVEENGTIHRTPTVAFVEATIAVKLDANAIRWRTLEKSTNVLPWQTHDCSEGRYRNHDDISSSRKPTKRANSRRTGISGNSL